jgi:hypothetical protein
MAWQIPWVNAIQAFGGVQTVPITITQNSNQYLCVMLGSTETRDTYFETATFDGQAYTRVATQSSSLDGEQSIDFIFFDISGKASGTYNFVYDVVFSAPDNGRIAYFPLIGGQIGGTILDTINQRVGNNTTMSLNTTTTVPDCIIIDAFTLDRSETPNPASGQTRIFTENLQGTTDYRWGASYRVTTNPGSYTMSWTHGNDYFVQVLGSFKPSVEGGAFLFNLL